jgi:hypothetical protein
VRGKLIHAGALGLAMLLLILVETALANKFETIGGGFSGSSGSKREWLHKFFLVGGSISLIAAVLSMIVPHSNPLLLNFNTWKQSAIVLFILAAAFFLGAVLV